PGARRPPRACGRDGRAARCAGRGGTPLPRRALGALPAPPQRGLLPGRGGRALDTAARLAAPDEALLLSPDELSVRSPRFRSAVFYRDGATVQPARLVRALRRAAGAAGGGRHQTTPRARGGGG